MKGFIFQRAANGIFWLIQANKKNAKNQIDLLTGGIGISEFMRNDMKAIEAIDRTQVMKRKSKCFNPPPAPSLDKEGEKMAPTGIRGRISNALIFTTTKR